MLNARSITLRIGSTTVLHEVDVRLKPGELTAIVGPNGAGKTSLVRVLSGEWKPDAGSVELESRPLRDWPVKKLGQRRAVLPQSSHLNFAFPVLEVVLMGRHPHTLREGETPHDLGIARKALEAVGMHGFADRPYTSLSGGEKQRVDLARVLAQVWEQPAEGARYLLLDEPTNNLDLSHQHQTLELGRRMARSGVAVLAVLHDLNLAMAYADRAVVLHRGGKAADGPVDRVLTPDLVRHVFGIHCQLTCLPGYSRPFIATLPAEDPGPAD